MKDDTSTPTPEGLSPSDLEAGKPGTNGRARSEAAIEDLRLRGGVFVEAVGATRMPMVLTDPTLPDNPIVFANQAFLMLAGYRMEDVLGQQPYFMNGPGTDPRDAARFAEAIRGDQDDIIETVQYRKDGSRFVATVLISAFKDEEGRVLNHFMCWRDVTRRVDAEKEVADFREWELALYESAAALRASEDRQAFLLKLSDALRPLSAPADIQATAARLVGQHLGVDRAMYAEVDGPPGSETGVMRGQYVRRAYNGRAAATPFSERFSYKPFGEHTLARRYRGELLIVDDVETAEGFDEAERSAWRKAGVRAAVVAPLAKGGRLVAEFGIHSTTPRAWSEHEVELVQDVAERTWDAAERARSEVALAASEEQYRSLFETMGQGFCELELVRDDSGRAVDQLYLQFNPAFERLFGIPIEDAKGRKASDLFPDLDPVWTETLARVAESGRPERIEHAFGANRWFEVFAYPAHGDRLTALYEDVSERKRAELALRKSEEKYRSLFVSMDQAYAVVEVLKDERAEWSDFRFLQVNPAFMRHTSLPYPVGKTAAELLGTPNPRWAKLYGEVLDTGKPLRVEETEQTLGNTFDVNIFRLDADSNRVAILFSNITERKRSEEALLRSERHSNMLLAELQHRVRNTLAVVRSIARRTASNTESAEDMLAHFQGRLDAFSRVQAALTRNPDARIDLASLIDDELVAHATREGDQVLVDGPAVTLGGRSAERLSLAIHELTTNAVKHGALVNERGRIQISWDKRSNGAGDELLLTWEESGVNLEGLEPNPDGFGMELLRRSLAYDVQGDTRVDLQKNGLRFELRMPLDEEDAVDA